MGENHTSTQRSLGSSWGILSLRKQPPRCQLLRARVGYRARAGSSEWVGAPGWTGERCGKCVDTRDRESLSHLAREQEACVRGRGHGAADPSFPPSPARGCWGPRGSSSSALSCLPPRALSSHPPGSPAPTACPALLEMQPRPHPRPPGALTLPTASSPSLASPFTLPQAPIPGSSRALALLPLSPHELSPSLAAPCAFPVLSSV